MREPDLVDALTRYVTITGKDPEVIFLNPDDWRKLGADVHPFGPHEVRLGLRSYAGLTIEFLPPDKEFFVGPKPPNIPVPSTEENPAMRAVMQQFARSVRFLRPILPGQPIHRLELNMDFEILMESEARAGIPFDSIDVFDVFKRAISGQRYILPHHHPLTRLVGWCYDNNITLIGYEIPQAFKLVYPPLHISDENCMLLADEDKKS